MKTTAQRKAERKRERRERLFGPAGFVEFVQALPCGKCGRSGSEVHHDPPEGLSKRGHWTRTVPLCSDCHTRAPDSRHEHNGGQVRFWAEIGTTREQAAREVQDAWANR